jgi:hypothetical protein
VCADALSQPHTPTRRLTLDNRPTTIALSSVPSETAANEANVRGALLRFGGCVGFAVVRDARAHLW